MVCRNCGFDNQNNNKKYCVNCGYLLLEEKKRVIKWNIIILFVIITVLCLECSFLLGSFIKSEKKKREAEAKNVPKYVYVLQAKSNININTKLSDSEIDFVKIPEDIYTKNMIEKSSYDASMCVTNDIIKDTIIYKDNLSTCNSSTGYELEYGYKAFKLKNNTYELNTKDYVDIYIKTIKEGKIVFDEFIKGIEIIDINSEDIILALKEEYNCLFNNLLSLGDTEFVLVNSHDRSFKGENSELRELLEEKTKNMGCAGYE